LRYFYFLDLYSFFRWLSPTFVGWVDVVDVAPGLRSACASLHPGLYSRHPHSRVENIDTSVMVACCFIRATRECGWPSQMTVAL
jgi:hypothetical protein